MIHINYKIKNKNKILNYLKNLNYLNHSLVENGKSTYDLYFKKENLKLFEEIIFIFNKLAGKNFYLLDFWTNFYEKGGYVKKHNHISKLNILKNVKQKSGVYYFKKPFNSGNIYLKNKLIKIKENDFLLFNSNVVHYTEPNLSNKKRIIFSINMAYKVEKILDENNKFKFIKH